MMAINWLTTELNRFVTARKNSMKELSEDILERGIGNRLSWLQPHLRADALGAVAQVVLADMEKGENLPAIKERLVNTVSEKIDYIVPTNDDTQYQVYLLQSYQRTIKLLADAMAAAEEEAIEEQLSPNGTSAFDPH